MATRSDGMSGNEGSREPKRPRPKKAKPVPKAVHKKPAKAPPKPKHQSSGASRKASPGRRNPSTPARKSEASKPAKRSAKDDPRTDQQLLDEARGGEDGPLAALYTRHRPGLLKLVRRWACSEHDALDIVQDSFLCLSAALPNLTLRGQLQPWLSMVARRRFLMHLRTERRTTKRCELLAAETNTWEDSLPELDTQDLLESLTSAHREILVLRILEGHTVPEIAELLDLSEGTVKSRLSRGLRALKRILDS